MLCVGGRVVHGLPPWRDREGCTAQAVFAQSFPGLPPYCPPPPPLPIHQKFPILFSHSDSGTQVGVEADKHQPSLIPPSHLSP